MKNPKVTPNLRNCVLATSEAKDLEIYKQADYEVKIFKCHSELLKVATQCRTDILKTISKHGPESLYELAKLVQKNQAYIYRETKILEKLGLVDFIKAESGGRKRVRPQNRYAQIVIHL